MKKPIVALALLALTCVAAWTQAGPAMRLSTGTWQLGGSLTFDIDTLIPSTGDTISGFKLNVNPSGGYFVADNLMIAGELGYEAGFGDLYDLSDSTLGFGVGAHYYYPVGALIAHAGALVGMSFTIPETGSTAKSFTLVAPIGALLPLNAHVAVDCGLRVAYTASLDDESSALSIPIGYLGVQAFF